MKDFNPESETLSRATSLLLATNDKIAQSLRVRTIAKGGVGQCGAIKKESELHLYAIVSSFEAIALNLVLSSSSQAYE